MPTLVRMPGVSADSDEAVLASWSVQPGGTVRAGGVLACVETEKALVDIESDQDAIAHALLVQPGATVPVGDPIAILREPGEPTGAADALLAELGRADAARPATPAPAAPAGPAAAPQDGKQAAPPGPAQPGRPGGTADRPAGRVLASPIARKLARENGLAVESIAGTGPGGRIIRRDVERAITTARTAPVTAGDQDSASADDPRWREVPHSSQRRLIAARLQASKRQVPHFYLRSTLRADALLSLRAQLTSAGGKRISVNDFLVKAAARALIDVPEMNVVWTDAALLRHAGADVSVAIASDRGLVAPVIRDVERLSLSALSALITDAAARANAGQLRQHELEGGTLTVSNLGMYGVEEFAAIINPPQAAILAVGAATRRPVASVGDAVEVATTMTVTLSVDHRCVDGVTAAAWLARLRELVENPLAIAA